MFIWTILRTANQGVADEALNIAFTVEALVRILALGSFKKYLSSAWNAFDAFIITLGYVSYVNIGGGTNGVRALRGLRALRPLRTMSRFKSLRTIVVCFLTVCARALAVLPLFL